MNTQEGRLSAYRDRDSSEIPGSGPTRQSAIPPPCAAARLFAHHRRESTIQDCPFPVSVDGKYEAVWGNSWEDTVRNAVSFGGDADTMACIAGSIAAATPGMEVPEEIADRCFWILDSHLRHELNLFDDFV